MINRDQLGQNLIKTVKINEERPAKDYSQIIKPIVFDGLTVASAVSFGYLYKQFIASGAGIVVLLVGFAVFSVFSALQAFLVNRSLFNRFLVILLETIAFMAFFYNEDLRLLGIVAAVTLALLFWGDIAGRSEMKNNIEIKFFKTAKPVLKKIITAIVFLTVVLYLPNVNKDNILISKRNFQFFFDGTIGFAEKFYPEINFRSSFGDMTKSVARLELMQQSEFKNLSEYQQEKILKQASAQISELINKNLNLDIAPGEKLSDAFYNFLVSVLEGWRVKFGENFLIGWAVIVFLTVRGFGIIFQWLISIISFLAYELLLATNFFQIIGESRTKEIVQF